MTTLIKYFITDDAADLLELRTPGSEYTLEGQQVTVSGFTRVNVVHAAAGVDLDVRNLVGGEDVVVFSYSWDQYTKDLSTPGAIIFSYLDTSNGLTERVTVLNGTTTAGNDKLIFADGTVLTKDANTALKTATPPAEGTTSGLTISAADLALMTSSKTEGGSALDTSTNSQTYVLPTPAGNTMKVFASTDNTNGVGATFNMADAGQTQILSGSTQVDKAYAKAGAVMDARNLLGGEDIIYLTGNWSDYTKSVTAEVGAIQLTRTVGDQTEVVTVLNGTTTSGNDKLVFADGAVLTKDANTALKTTVSPSEGGTFGLDISADDLALITSSQAGGGSAWDPTTRPPFLSDIQSVAIDTTATSATTSGYLNEGDTLVISVAMKSPVDVAGAGTPRIALNVGGDIVYADYDSTLTGPNVDGLSMLKFKYTLPAGTTPLLDTDGISIDADAIGLSGGTINLTGTSTAARLTHNAVADNVSYFVDNVAPAAPTIDLGAGVADGVTVAEAIASSGVVAVTADADASVVVTMTNSADNTKTLTKTVTGTGGAQVVTLTAQDLAVLGDGTINVGAVATDAAGNASEAGTASFSLDTTAPTVVIISDLNALKAGETATITFTFTEAPTGFDAADVTTTGGTLSAITGSGLTRTATFTPAVNSTTAASITVGTSYTDAAGNMGVAGKTPTITIDTIAPAIPSVASAITSATALNGLDSIYGSAEANSVVTLTITPTSGNAVVVTAAADAAGAWFYTPTSAFANGTYALTLSAVDTAGNTSAVSTPLSLTFSAAAPHAPSVALAAGSDTGVQGDSITNTTTPVFNISGIDAAATAVQVSVDGGTWATVAGFTTGSTSLTYTASALSGSSTGVAHAVSVRQTVGGVVSLASVPEAIVVDNALSSTTRPSDGAFGYARYVMVRSNPGDAINLMFTELEVYSNGVNVALNKPGAAAGNSPSTTGVRFYGSNLAMAVDGNKVARLDQYIDNATLALDASYIWLQVDLGAEYAIEEIKMYGLGDNRERNMTVFASKSDMSSKNYAALTADSAVIKSVYTGSALTSSGVSFSTDLNLDYLSGATEAGAKVEILDTNNVIVKTLTADSQGNWFAFLSDQAVGTRSYNVKVTDLAGNATTTSRAVTVLAPSTNVTMTGLNAGTDSGALGDGVTNASTPVLQGTATAGSTVTIKKGATTLGTVTASGTGAWEFNLSGLGDGSHAFRAELGENKSLPFTVIKDTAAPAVSITSSKAALKIGETAVITFTFTETPTGFDAADVTVTGGTLGAITGTGLTRTATFTPSVNSTTPASITVGTGYTDAAGNTGGAGTTPTITIDTIAPDAVDLGPTAEIQASSSVDANKAQIAAGVAFDSDVAAPSATDIREVKFVFAGAALNSSNDKLVLDVDLSLASDQSGSSVTLGGVTGIDYSYTAADNTLLVSRNNAANFTPSDVESIVQAIKLKNAALTPGDGARTAAISYINAAGNEGIAATATINVYATPPEISSVTDDHPNVIVSGVDAGLDGVYSLVSDLSGLVFSNDFNPSGEPSVIDINKPIYQYANVGTGETWYLWARAGSGYHISQTNDASKWYWESVFDPADFAANPVDISSWMHSTQAAPDFFAEPVFTADVSNDVTSALVTYTLTFNRAVEQSSFTSDDIKLVNDSGTDITANWTIGTPATSDGGTTWTVTVTPPTGVNAIDETPAHLKIDANRITDIYGNSNAELLQASASQRFDTLRPLAPTLTLNVDTGSNTGDGVTKDGVINVGGLDANLGSWRYSLDGGASWTTGTGSSFTLDAGSYAAGLIRVAQSDRAGLTSSIAQYLSALRVDTWLATPVLSPLDGANLTKSSLLVLTFTENVSAVADKNIVIKNSTGAVMETIAANSAQVGISGGVVTVNPTDSNLSVGGSYYIEVDGGAFVDIAGNASAAIGSHEWDVNVAAIVSNIAVATDNLVNDAENSSGITVRVTVSAEANLLPDLVANDFTVTVVKDSDGSAVTLTGASYNGTTGIWTATIAGGTFLDGETYTVKANITGSAGNANGISAPQSTQAVTVDLTTPTLDTVVIASDDKVNSAEVNGGFIISGTTTGLPADVPVRVTLNGVTYTANTLADGRWSLQVSSANAANLMDGSSYAVTVDASDIHGNAATRLIQNITVDKSAPAFTVIVDESISSLPTIVGESSEPVVQVKLDLNSDGTYGGDGEGTYTVNVVNGNWSLDLASVSADGQSSPISYSDITAQTLGVQVSATDDYGNVAVKTEVVAKDVSSYSLSDARVLEGTSGTKSLTFIVTRDGDLSSGGSVDYAIDTTLSSAKSGGTESHNDYTGEGAGSVTFMAGEQFKEVTLTVTGDYYKEVNQNIVMTLSNPTNGALAKDTGVAELSEVDASLMAGAFSLNDVNRELVTNAIRVRRSSDNQEMDIGFDKYGNLDTEALLGFVNDNDLGVAVAGAQGYVTSWYDQSGHSKNLAQTTFDKQGVIVNNGALVTTSDNAATISFNNGLNGTANDGMSMAGAGGSATNVEVYAAYQYESAAAGGMMFNLGVSDTSTGRISVHAPHVSAGNTYTTYWDVGDINSLGRLSTVNAQTIDVRQELVFTANYNHVGAGTTGQNKVDAKQAFFVDGVVKGADGTLNGSSLALGNTWYLMSGTANDYYQRGEISEFLIYTSSESKTISAPNKFVGSGVNNAFTYAGDPSLTSIDGKAGYDVVTLSGVNTGLNAGAVALAGIELIHMRNGVVNKFTINDAQLLSNGNVLSVLLDAGDSIVYNGNTISYSTTQEFVVFGTAGNNSIAMSSFNESVYGKGGSDTFVYQSWSDAAASSSADTITDFTLGTAGNADADKLNFADLLQGYDPANIADFVRLEADATTGQVSVKVDYNGKADGSVFTPNLQVDLTGVTLAASDAAYGTTQADLDALRAAMMSNGQLILV